MSDDTYKTIICILCVFIVAVVIAGRVVHDSLKEDAVKNGVAEYRIVNTNTGKTQLFWITNK